MDSQWKKPWTRNEKRRGQGLRKKYGQDIRKRRDKK